MNFRDIDKEPLQVSVPPDIGEEVRVLMARRRGRSQSMVVTELLCIVFDKDPRQYGIEPSIKQALAAAS